MKNEKNNFTYYEGYNLDQENHESILKKGIDVLKKEGLFTLIENTLIYVLYKINYGLINKHFYIDGVRYHYFIHIYNAVISERVVEIPFAIDFLKKNQYKEKKVLEVGNVLSNYFNFKHRIIDKYEKKDYVDNIDIVDVTGDEKYDIIVSISTLEHVGFDEPKKEKGKSKKAIMKLIDLLNDDGILLITVPLRYNPEIDSIIINDEIKFSKKYFLVRYSKLNLWRQTNMEEAMKCVYGSKYPAANSVAFLIYSKNS